MLTEIFAIIAIIIGICMWIISIVENKESSKITIDTREQPQKKKQVKFGRQYERIFDKEDPPEFISRKPSLKVNM